MRILLVGPDHGRGSIPPYLAVLTDALRRLGASVDRLGSTGIPFDEGTGSWWDTDRIVSTARELAFRVDPRRYDMVSLHFGNLEIEQLLPALWAAEIGAAGEVLPPVVHHVHSLDWTLFGHHRPDEHHRRDVEAGICGVTGLVFFGAYARAELAARLPRTGSLPAVTTPLPSTIPAGTAPATDPALVRALTPSGEAALFTLCGFAAPWKDAAGLLAALAHTTAPIRVVLAGPYWDDPAQAGCDLSPATRVPMRLGRAAEFVVVPEYLAPAERAALVARSDAGVFPYRHHPAFQGSGAIADCLAAATPVVATDVANMTELIGASGLIVAPGCPADLARALDAVATDTTLRGQLTAAASLRAETFTGAAHAAACLDLYRSLTPAHRTPRDTQPWTATPGSSSPGTGTPTATRTRPSPGWRPAAG